MKSLTRSFVLIIALSGLLNADTYTPAEDGDWSTLGLWEDNSAGSYGSSTELPVEHDSVVIKSGRTLSLDMDAETKRLYVSNQLSDGSLLLNHPFTLRSKLTFVGNDKNQGQGLISITQGALDVNGALTIHSNGRIVIDGGVLGNLSGANRTFNGGGTIELLRGRLCMLGAEQGSNNKVIFDNALTIISGGVLQAEQLLLGQQSEAEFRIVGDDAIIQLQNLNLRPRVAALGTIRFVLDEDRVSTVEVANVAHLAGGKLIVDGASYRGESQTFTLFKSDKLLSPVKPENITVTGLGKEGKGWRLIQDREDSMSVSLEIIR